MAALTATPATFDAQLAKALAGDTLSLAPGNYGDLYVKKAVPVTLAFQSGAVARSLNVQSTTGLTVTGLTIAFIPDAKTVSYSSAVNIQNSTGVTITGGTLRGGAAITGVAANATALDGTGNVIGYPTARGVSIQQSSNVILDGLDISAFHRGIFLNQSSKVTLKNNNVHDLRTSAIVGAEVFDLTIDGNWLHDAKPWAWGKTLTGSDGKPLPTYGDHADFIALWSNAAQTTPNARVKITNNRMEQTAGEAILGMWFQGSTGAPYTDFVISGNSFKLANLQGIRLWNSGPGAITGNTLAWVANQPDGTPNDPKQAPGILLEGGVSGVTVSGNSAYAYAGTAVTNAAALQAANTLLSASISTTGVKPAPTPDPRDAQIADLTAKLSAATASNADLSAKLMSVTTDRDTQAAKASSLQTALDGATAAGKALRDALTAIQSQVANALA